jgi:hypothetical protein
MVMQNTVYEVQWTPPIAITDNIIIRVLLSLS